jgi:hypothetical protein
LLTSVVKQFLLLAKRAFVETGIAYPRSLHGVVVDYAPACLHLL